MEVKQDYTPPIEPKPKKTLFSVIISILSFLLLPFKFARVQLLKVREDNKKISAYKLWWRKENYRYRRQNKLNDEF